MLRTNSKQAKENLKAYIIAGWDFEEENARDWKTVKEDIKSSFIKAAYSSEYERKQSRQEAFAGWLAGLPHNIGDFYLCQAVDDLAAILEETPAEAARFTEDQAEQKLAAMIYNIIFY